MSSSDDSWNFGGVKPIVGLVKGQNAVASNQKEEWMKARDALKDAERAGIKGEMLSTLKANEAAKRAKLESATGQSAESSS